MKLRLLPSSFERDGSASPRQHLACFLINDEIAIDAGSLAMAVDAVERDRIQDIVLSHSHLDHIAGLPLFIDDRFAKLTEPVRVHASQEVIDVLERDIFNWSVYPKFSELENEHGKILEYRPFSKGEEFVIGSTRITPLAVNHKVPSCGFVISDDHASIAMTGDTAGMDDFWNNLARFDELKALFIECAFPNELQAIAANSCHMTPRALAAELKKFARPDCPVYVINIKPAYREEVVRELEELSIPGLSVLEVGREYSW